MYVIVCMYVRMYVCSVPFSAPQHVFDVRKCENDTPLSSFLCPWDARKNQLALGLKGDGEKTGPLRTQLFFIHVACWRVSHVHCFWWPLLLIFSFFCFIDKNAETNCQ